MMKPKAKRGRGRWNIPCAALLGFTSVTLLFIVYLRHQRLQSAVDLTWTNLDELDNTHVADAIIETTGDAVDTITDAEDLVDTSYFEKNKKDETQKQKAFTKATQEYSRIIVVGDLHGDLRQTRKILKEFQLLDDNMNWIGKNTALIQIGDVLDRGAASLPTTDLLEKIRRQARWEGGDVILLMGNHELNNLQGDTRFVNKQELQDLGKRARKPGARGSILGDYLLGLQQWKHDLSHDEYYGTVLRSRPLALLLGEDKCRSLFIHAGVFSWMLEGTKQTLNHTTADPPLTPEQYVANWNAEVKKAVDGCLDKDCPPKEKVHHTQFQSALIGSQGPMSSRYFSNTEEAVLCGEVEPLLQALKVVRVVVGHVLQADGKIHTKCKGRIVFADAGIAKEQGGHIAAFECSNNVAKALYPDHHDFIT